ncbi:conserved hypothetical protein [Chlorobium phaeobacteroides DSM 266]|jgi:hypothetical protein|uniref:Uncharacterized protein n=1 Tax=Chlorobium phaeobacteroides (strain DSM 266 / SMG 266 / 2430) TaxID=290317 RepID=A1BIS6_CHLPD|nr:conserved hypothetical protein [Chlorobium phaeobacteroides DSM 266]
MAPGKKNILRSFLRVFEILLFFVISVVGFNVLAKTASQNGKSKNRILSRNILRVNELASSELQHLSRSSDFFICEQTPVTQNSSALSFHAPVAISHYAYAALPINPLLSQEKHQCPDPFLDKPANLFQQNPVLLI